jgi:hypothetical protein
VHLTVAGTSRDAAVELVKRLERSPSFRDARIAEESAILEKDTTDTVKFQMTAVYVPTTAPEAPAPAAPEKAAEKAGGSK